VTDAVAALALGGGIGCAMRTREIDGTSTVPSRGMTIGFRRASDCPPTRR